MDKIIEQRYSTCFWWSTVLLSGTRRRVRSTPGTRFSKSTRDRDIRLNNKNTHAHKYTHLRHVGRVLSVRQNNVPVNCLGKIVYGRITRELCRNPHWFVWWSAFTTSIRRKRHDVCIVVFSRGKHASLECVGGARRSYNNIRLKTYRLNPSTYV